MGAFRSKFGPRCRITRIMRMSARRNIGRTRPSTAPKCGRTRSGVGAANLANIQIGPKSAPILAEVGANKDELGRIWPDSPQIWPKSAKRGQHRTRVAETRPKVGRTESAFGPRRSKSGQTSSQFGRAPPQLGRLRPNIGFGPYSGPIWPDPLSNSELRAPSSDLGPLPGEPPIDLRARDRADRVIVPKAVAVFVSVRPCRRDGPAVIVAASAVSGIMVC